MSGRPAIPPGEPARPQVHPPRGYRTASFAENFRRKTGNSRRRPRSAFTLVEVLIATALFGLATAGLFLALTPAYDALHRLSSASGDDGDLEIVRTLAEASATKEALLAGGSLSLPDGTPAQWTAEITPTETEALFRVNLRVERPERAPLALDYLRFEPKWLDQNEKPRWLDHSGRSGTPSAGASAGGAPRPPGAAGVTPPPRGGKGGPAAPDRNGGNRRGGPGERGGRGGRPGGNFGPPPPGGAGQPAPKSGGAR